MYIEKASAVVVVVVVVDYKASAWIVDKKLGMATFLEGADTVEVVAVDTAAAELLEMKKRGLSLEYSAVVVWVAGLEQQNLPMKHPLSHPSEALLSLFFWQSRNH